MLVVEVDMASDVALIVEVGMTSDAVVVVEVDKDYNFLHNSVIVVLRMDFPWVEVDSP